MPDLSSFCAHLPESRGAIVLTIHGHHRRTLGASIAFQWTDAELIFKCHRKALWQLFRTNQDILQRAEALRRATLHIRLQERWRRNQKRHSVLLHERADHLRIEWIRVEHNTHALYRRQPKPGCKSEGVKERQYSEN